MFNPFNIDWGSVIDAILRAIFLRGRGDLGARLASVAQAMSQRPLPDFAASWWLSQWMTFYTVTWVFAICYNIYAGARIGFARRNLDKDKLIDAIHPIRVVLAGPIIAALLVILTFFVEGGRLLALNGVEGQDWSQPLKSLQNDDSGNWFINQLVAGVGSWLLGNEVDSMTHLVYVFSFLLLLGYTFIRRRRMKWLFQVSMSVVLGLSVAYPLQIAIVRLGAETVGSNYGYGIMIVLTAAALPIIASISIGRSIDFVRLAGGKTEVTGETETTPDDTPQRVKVEDELATRLTAMQPVQIATAQQAARDVPAGMLPHVPGADPQDTLIEQHAAMPGFTSAHATTSSDVDVVVNGATGTRVTHQESAAAVTATSEHNGSPHDSTTWPAPETLEDPWADENVPGTTQFEPYPTDLSQGGDMTNGTND